METLVMIFDDWYCFAPDDKNGERLAFEEFIKKNTNIKVECWKNYSTFGKSLFFGESENIRDGIARPISILVNIGASLLIARELGMYEVGIFALARTVTSGLESTLRFPVDTLIPRALASGGKESNEPHIRYDLCVSKSSFMHLFFVLDRYCRFS